MSRRSRVRRAQREVVIPFANRGLLSLPRPIRHSLPVGSLSPFEDRRSFSPVRHARPAFSLPRSAARVVMSPRPAFRQTKARLMFALPTGVAICVRRKSRREVLFASGGAGGRGRQRPRRRTEFSDVSCR